MLNSISGGSGPSLVGSSKAGVSVGGPGGSSFADMLVSTTGDGRSSDLATAAAANAASTDVGMLAQLVGAFRGAGAGNTIGVATIGSNGKVIADASIAPNGDLSAYGSGQSGGSTSSVDLSLDAQDSGSWFGDVSAELAQASYQLNSLAAQSLAASKGTGVDAAA